MWKKLERLWQSVKGVGGLGSLWNNGSEWGARLHIPLLVLYAGLVAVSVGVVVVALANLFKAVRHAN